MTSPIAPPASMAAAMRCSTAEDIHAREQRMAEAIDAGRAIGEVMSADYEDMLKRQEA